MFYFNLQNPSFTIDDPEGQKNQPKFTVEQSHILNEEGKSYVQNKLFTKIGAIK